MALTENLAGFKLGFDETRHYVLVEEELGSVLPLPHPFDRCVESPSDGLWFFRFWTGGRGEAIGRRNGSPLALPLAGRLEFLTSAVGREISHTHVALPGAIHLAVVSLGLICSRAEWALGGVLVSTSAGRVLRRQFHSRWWSSPNGLDDLQTIIRRKVHFTWGTSERA